MNFDLRIVFPGVLIIGLLSYAVWHDIHNRRIPNQLVLCGALTGLALNTLLPAGAGLFEPAFGGLGLVKSLAGLGVGLAILLPMYVLGAMGAGDVKLMAMVGAFLGPQAVIGAALMSLLAGGVLALGVALWTGVLPKVITNLHLMLLKTFFRKLEGKGTYVEAPIAVSGELAYAIAIAAGTVLYIFLARTRVWGLLP